MANRDRKAIVRSKPKREKPKSGPAFPFAVQSAKPVGKAK